MVEARSGEHEELILDKRMEADRWKNKCKDVDGERVPLSGD